MPTTPQDHQKPAAQREAENAETVVVTHADLKFTIAADVADWDVDALEAFEDGKAAAAVRAVLGPQQWAEFKKTKPKTRDLAAVSDAIASAMGFETAGN